MSFECINVNHFHIEVINHTKLSKYTENFRCMGKYPYSPPFLERETTNLTSDFLSNKSLLSN